MHPRGFDGRMDALSKAGQRYFQIFPSQQHEGTLDALIGDARPLSQKRYQIAHSVVVADFRLDDKSWPGDTGPPPPHYGIAAPWYAAVSLTRRDKPLVPKGVPFWMYSYRIKEIDAFAQQFRDVGLRVTRLIDTLDPQD